MISIIFLLLNSKLILAIYETTELAFFKNRKIYSLQLYKRQHFRLVSLNNIKIRY